MTITIPLWYIIGFGVLVLCIAWGWTYRTLSDFYNWKDDLVPFSLAGSIIFFPLALGLAIVIWVRDRGQKRHCGEE